MDAVWRRPLMGMFSARGHGADKNVLAVHRAWAAKEYVDPKRIGIWGWVSCFLFYAHVVAMGLICVSPMEAL